MGYRERGKRKFLPFPVGAEDKQHSTLPPWFFVNYPMLEMSEKSCQQNNWIIVMLEWHCVSVSLLLAVSFVQWTSTEAAPAEPSTESLDTAVVLDGSSHSVSSEEKSAADLAAKILLLDELVSLENDVIETKKKRSFPGFGSPLDRLSAGTTEFKGKQRKVVELPKRRFGIPLDRIGMNRLANTRG
uniref:Osteocrin n=2 Tax=Xenopus tropicalis TaxID=8364 RepID=F7DLL7_XENTR